MKDPQAELAGRYFNYLARCFPVMCASDEFHFFPRAQATSRYSLRTENLKPEAIYETVSTLKKFKDKIELFAGQENDIERLTDLELLKANLTGILIELETKQSWRHNPLLYLKIGFIGLDRALISNAFGQEEQAERILVSLQKIPKLLQQAIANMDSVPRTYHEAALAMLSDCKSYLTEISESLIQTAGEHFTEVLQKVWSALDAFSRFLNTLIPIPDQKFLVPGFEATLKEHFLSIRTLPEVFQIAVEEWRENLEQLEKLRASLDPSRSWLELYHSCSPPDIEKTDIISLYNREIERLDDFFRKHGFGELGVSLSLELCETPTYLRSVRRSASFSAALKANDGEKDFFYITTHSSPYISKGSGDHIKRRLHREYKFLSAHEAIPGHHLLDSVRRRLKNPVRRQIESPLFYEGWAYYAESLLAEYGYVDTPVDCLVDCKRRLWRAARCQIDVGLVTGALSKADCMKILTTAGFSPEESGSQLDHFRLNPGYQLCYSLGRYEIMKLRETYAKQLGLDQFHRLLLEGGELPFHLIEKRFKNLNTVRRRSGKE